MDTVSIAYANALFDLSLEEKNENAVLEQMDMINTAVTGNEELVKILASKNLSKDEKKDILVKVFADNVDKDVMNFLKLLVDKSRINHVKDIAKAYKNAYLEHFEIKEAIIYSTTLLDESKVEEIKDALEQKYNQKYIAINKIDESLVAGIKVVINDLVIDGSVKNKLDRMKATILNK